MIYYNVKWADSRCELPALTGKICSYFQGDSCRNDVDKPRRVGRTSLTNLSISQDKKLYLVDHSREIRRGASPQLPNTRPSPNPESLMQAHVPGQLIVICQRMGQTNPTFYPATCLSPTTFTSLCQVTPTKVLVKKIGFTLPGQLKSVFWLCPLGLIKMSLLITIFLLVFITQLITWIGKSVLLDFVRYYHCLALNKILLTT